MDTGSSTQSDPVSDVTSPAASRTSSRPSDASILFSALDRQYRKSIAGFSKLLPEGQLPVYADGSLDYECCRWNEPITSSPTGAAKDFLEEAKTSDTPPRWYIYGSDGKCLWCDDEPETPASRIQFPIESSIVMLRPISTPIELPGGRLVRYKPVVIERNASLMKCACKLRPDCLRRGAQSTD